MNDQKIITEPPKLLVAVAIALLTFYTGIVIYLVYSVRDLGQRISSLEQSQAFDVKFEEKVDSLVKSGAADSQLLRDIQVTMTEMKDNQKRIENKIDSHVTESAKRSPESQQEKDYK